MTKTEKSSSVVPQGVFQTASSMVVGAKINTATGSGSSGDRMVSTRKASGTVSVRSTTRSFQTAGCRNTF